MTLYPGTLTAAVLGGWGLGLAALAFLELLLWALGLPRISEHVWAHPWLGIPIIAFCLIGPGYLTGHFYFGWDHFTGVGM